VTTPVRSPARRRERGATVDAVTHSAEPPVLPAVAAGRDGAATELWDRYADRVRSLGLRLSGFDPRFADDLVQETFTKLWRGAGRFDESKGTEATFVFTVARRAAVDQWRRGRRSATDRPLGNQDGGHERAATDGRLDESTNGEDHVDAVLTGWVVAEALEGLGPPQREVIELAYYRQMSQSEIAAHLGIPLGTVKTRTFAALKALRTALSDKGVVS
jgi:RNA polymerase sigma-70 factor (ECF subfamily)